MLEFIQQYWLGVAFSGVVGLFTLGYKTLAKKIAKKNEKEEYMFDGLKSLLYDRLRQSYNYHMNKRCISIDDFNCFNRLYESYHKLGGNGAGTEMLARLKDLPASN